MGKKEGLQKISKNGLFFIVALDHRNSLKKILEKSGFDVTDNLIKIIKKEFTKTFTLKSSAILLDPEYGLDAKSLIGNVGLLISLEESGYSEKAGGRLTKISKDWDVKQIKEAGGDAVKLLLYFNPESETKKKQLSLVKKVAKDCKKFNIPFLCEPFIYPLEEDKNFINKKPNLIIKAVETISKMGVDVLKLQFPGDVNAHSEKKLVKNCREMNEVSKVPWVLLSAGISYEEFRKQLEIATRNGASGYAVGRALWQDAFKTNSLQEVINFVSTIGVERLNELNKICIKNIK